MILIVIIVIVALLVLWVISTYNGLVKMRIQVEEAFSTMDVYLKKRFDLIPNLVATVKGYTKHEAETLEKVIASRNGAKTTDERMAAESKISGSIRNIFAVAESYPDLKANSNFMDLQGQLKSIEDEIANSRKYYNGTVKQYNVKCETVPSNIVAGLFHFEKKPLYEVEDASERQNVKVEF